MIHYEWPLQEAVVWFVARAIAVPHKFMCHDRGGAVTELQHLFELKRGVLPGWPDTELCLPQGKTFRCELKRLGQQIKLGSAQDYIRTELLRLDHSCTEADSVMAYGEACMRFGVPLKANWRTQAQLADERVAANIREQKEKEAKKKSANTGPDLAIRPRPKVRRKVGPRTLARIYTAMKPSL